MIVHHGLLTLALVTFHVAVFAVPSSPVRWIQFGFEVAPFADATRQDAVQPQQKPSQQTLPATQARVPATQDPPAGEDVRPRVPPYREVADAMQAVGQRITANDTSAQTQQLQQQILDQMDRLIEAETQKSSTPAPILQPTPSMAGQQSRSGQPSSGDPTGDASTGSTPASHQNRAQRARQQWMERVWGHLPERLRTRMQGDQQQQFLPKYEKLIEEYFKRLADSQNNPP